MELRRLAYISGFPPRVSEEQLVEIIRSNIGKYSFNKISISKGRNFAIVYFSERESLKGACQLMKGVKINNHKLLFQERPHNKIVIEMITNDRNWDIISVWIKKRIVSPKQAFFTSLGGKTSLLHIAVRFENIKTIEALLSTGMSINIADLHGRTPIHFACIFGRLKSLKALINRGAEIDVTDAESNTPSPPKNVNGKTPQDLWKRGLDTDIFSKLEKIQVGNRSKVIFKSDGVHALFFSRDPNDGRIKVLLMKQFVKNFRNRFFCGKRVVTLEGVEYIFVLYFFESLYQYYMIVKNTKTGEVFYCKDVCKYVWKTFFRIGSKFENASQLVLQQQEKKKKKTKKKKRKSTEEDDDDIDIDDDKMYSTFLGKDDNPVMVKKVMENEDEKEEEEEIGGEDEKEVEDIEITIRQKYNVDFCIHLSKLDIELLFFVDETWGEFVCEFDPVQDVDDIRSSLARVVSAQTYGALSHHMKKKSIKKVMKIIEEDPRSMVHNMSSLSLHQHFPFFFLRSKYMPLDDLDPRHYTGDGYPPIEFNWFPIDDVFKMMRWKKYFLEEEVEGEEEEEKESTLMLKYREPELPTPKELVGFVKLCEEIPTFLQKMKNTLILPFSVWEKIILEYCDLKTLCFVRSACTFLRDVCYRAKNVVFDENVGHPKFLLTLFLQMRSITILEKKDFHEFVFHHISQNSDLQELHILFEISPKLMKEVSTALLQKASFQSLSLRNCRNLSNFEFLRSMLGLNSMNKYVRQIEIGGIFERNIQHSLVEILVTESLVRFPKLVLWDMDLLGMFPVWRNFLQFVKVQHVVLNVSDLKFAMNEMESYNEDAWIDLERFWEEMFMAMESNSCLIQVTSNIPTLHVIRRRSNVLQKVTINVPRELMTEEEKEEEKAYLERQRRALRGEDVFLGDDGQLDENAVYFDSSSDEDEDLTQVEHMEERNRAMRRMEDNVEREKIQQKINTEKGERDKRTIWSIFVIIISILFAFIFFRDV